MESQQLLMAHRSKSDAMAEDAQRPKRTNTSLGLVYQRTINTTVFLTVIFFAPLSLTYFLDQPHTSNLSDKVLAVLISPEFAYGKGSGTLFDENGGQIRIYLRNFNAMFSHTIAGSIAITVGLVQFNTSFQFKYPVVHRSLGRLYVLLAVIISWSSRSFLADAMPTKEVFSGEPFAYILSTLSIGVLETIGLAIYGIWNRDIGSHREFMVLNYAFMLSAPVLRICWLVLGRLWGESKFVVNLYSSIFSGPFLIFATMIYLRQQNIRPSNSILISWKVRLVVIACGLFGLFFQITKGPKFNGGSHPKAFWIALGPQLLCYTILFSMLACAAKRRGDMGSYTAWITYLNGLISAPMWSMVVLYVARNMMGFSEGCLGMITISGGVMQGLFNSFVIYVLATSKMITRNRQNFKGH